MQTVRNLKKNDQRMGDLGAVLVSVKKKQQFPKVFENLPTGSLMI